MIKTSRKTVLVVEDDPDVRETVVAILEDEGYRVAAAADGVEALAWLRRETGRPCVILLDLMMPVMDGWRFREEQRSDAGLAAIPVVVLSARNDVRTFDAALLLHKPVEVTALLDAVARFC